MSRAKRFYEVDLLRFLAAFAVLLFHYTFRGNAADGLSVLAYPWLVPVTKYGYLGVDLFFIISGFVILMTASAGSTKQFIVSRVVRLYPAYWVCCTLTFVVLHFFPPTRHVTTTVEYLQNMTMLNGLLYIPYVDSVYWSLLVELKFYFLVFLVLLAGQIHRTKWLLGLWFVAYMAAETLHLNRVAFVFFPEFAPYFIAGAAVFLVTKEGMDLYKGVLIVACYFAVAFHSNNGIADMQAHYHTSFSVWVVRATQAAFFVLFYLLVTGRLTALASKRFFVLGTLTYPLYLIHQNIGFALFNALAPKVNVHVVLWGVTALMIGAAYVVTRVEKAVAPPMKAQLSKLLGLRRAEAKA